MTGVGHVSMRGVGKRFGHNEVLRNIDLEVGKGEVCAVIGPSGSGKSTLLRCINGLERVDAGSVNVNGEEIGRRLTANRSAFIELSPAELARQRTGIGMVFQQFNLFPNLTVLDNVTLALRSVLKMGRVQAEEVARARLSQVAMADYAARYPRTLSGGQQQRVAIARALATNPSVILFDEPTSALDPELVGEVIQTLRDLAHQSMTMLVVTHEMSFARDACTRTIFMENGSIVEDGPSAQIYSTPTSARTARFLERVLQK